MQPENPFEPVPTGIDYLNQISSPPPSPGMSKMSKIILIAAGALGIIGAIVLLALASSGSSAASPKELAAKFRKVHSISETYRDKIRNSDLQSTNGSLFTVLTTANTSMAEILLEEEGFDPRRKDKELVAMDPPDELIAKLDEAYLLNQLDSAFAHEVNIQISETLSMISGLESRNLSDDFSELIKKVSDDLKNIQKQLEKVIDPYYEAPAEVPLPEDNK